MVLEALVAAGGGHVGPSLSCVDILSALYDHVVRHRPRQPDWSERDRVILSKGHGCVALYAVLASHGYFPADELATVGARGSRLGGHPERHLVPGVEFSTGSLGHGFSVGVGIALALQRRESDARTFVVVGDGELGEGSIWEAAASAAHHGLCRLAVLIDRNGLQSSGRTKKVLDLEPLAAKFEAFGWNVTEVDGHDVGSLVATLSVLPYDRIRPSAVICRTVKGKGLAVAEDDPSWHYRAGLTTELVRPPPKQFPPRRRHCPRRTTVADSVFDAVDRLARQDDRIVFIGSDLSPGLLSDLARDRPGQCLSEGIQEQHLIGMAAGMAMEGALPIVATIATFLTRRCFEQILIDVGLHGLPVTLLGTGAGLAYAALGPTHCAVDDLALLRTVPNLHVASPASNSEAIDLLEDGLKRGVPMYLRVPRGDETPLPAMPERRRLGHAIVLTEGTDVVFVTTGVMTAAALEAARSLGTAGWSAGVVHVHTIKPFDAQTVLDGIGSAPVVVTAEEHRRAGGLGSVVLEALNDAGVRRISIVRLGLPDAFVTGYGSHADSLLGAGLSIEGLEVAARGLLEPR